MKLITPPYLLLIAALSPVVALYAQPSVRNIAANEPRAIPSVQLTDVAKNDDPQALQLVTDGGGWASWTDLYRYSKFGKLLLINIYPVGCANCVSSEKSLSANEDLRTFLDQRFIRTKVNSIERPDLERVARATMALQPPHPMPQMMTLICLPDGTPFWSGTFTDLNSWASNLRHLAEEYRNSPANIQTIARQMDAQLVKKYGNPAGISNPRSAAQLKDLAAKTYITLKNATTEHSPEVYRFLVRYYHNQGNTDVVKELLSEVSELAIANWQLLDGYALADGGENTDDHFMLSHQVQLMSLFTECYKIQNDAALRKASFQIIHFVQQEMWNYYKVAFVPFPGKDEYSKDPNQIVTSWNAMMLKACIAAYRTFGEERFKGQALSLANYFNYGIVEPSGAVWHSGAKQQIGFLDDYAHVADAFLELYQITFDEQWLYRSKKVTDYAMATFKNNNSATLNYVASNSELLRLTTPINDRTDLPASPSSSAILSRVIYSLGVMFHKDIYKQTAEKMLDEGLALASGDLLASANWGMLYDMMMRVPYEVAVVGENFTHLLRGLDSYYMPYVLFYGGKSEGTLESLKDKLIPGETVIYICQGKVCNMPTTDVAEAVAMMSEEE